MVFQPKSTLIGVSDVVKVLSNLYGYRFCCTTTWVYESLVKRTHNEQLGFGVLNGTFQHFAQHFSLVAELIIETANTDASWAKYIFNKIHA